MELWETVSSPAHFILKRKSKYNECFLRSYLSEIINI